MRGYALIALHCAGSGHTGGTLSALDAVSVLYLRTMRHQPYDPNWDGRDRLFFSPDPLGPKGEVGFIYPGSGNQFPDMGRDMALEWPEVLRLQDSQNRLLCEQFQPGAFPTKLQ